MADQKTQLDVILNVKGVKELRSLTNSLQGLKNNAKNAGLDTKKFTQELRKLQNEGVNSINRTRALSNTYKELANSVDITSREFKEATREARRLDRELAKMERRKTTGGRARGLARGLGAVAAGGVFGGVEGLVGGGIGLAVTGNAFGAAAGAAIGAQVGQLRKSIGEIGVYTASLKQQKFALALVVKDTEKFNKAQEFLAQTSEKLAIPQDVIVRQFTSLTASVVGAGKSVEDAQEVFLSIASGIRGTGGSLEDMRAAMVATSQVFSKGKVSAEELRQQLGERLPGAFTLFAASMDKTPAQLDKALEQGKVTLDDFMGFAKHLFANYGKNAEILASSPAAAGDRLATEFSKFKENFGGLFANIGAGFQDTTTKIISFLNDNEKAIKKFITNFVNNVGGIKRVLTKVATDIANIVSGIFKSFTGIITKIFNKVAEMVNKLLEALGETLEGFKKIPGLGQFIENIQTTSFIPTIDPDTKKTINNALQPAVDYKDELAKIFKESGKTVEEVFGSPEFDAAVEKIIKQKQATEELNAATKDLGNTTSKVFDGLKSGAQGYLNSIKDTTKQIQDAFVNAFKGMEDALVQFVLTGKLNFRNLAQSIIADIARIVVRQQLMTPLLGGINSLFGLDLKLNAKGNAFGANAIIPYAKGGVVSQPQLFKFSTGGSGKLGIMGEGGAPEAILPLKRGRSGNLGVEASGSSNNIVVNVDASGSSVQGDNDDARQFGNVIATAIQSELIKQKRPGGLLA